MHRSPSLLRRGSAAAALLALALSACDQAVPTDAGYEAVSASTADAQGPDIIPGRFIVALRADADPAEVARGHGVRADFVYSAALNGFAGSISEAARSGLMRDARVVMIEPDRIISISGTQSNATWGLDRIDQRSRPLNGTYTYDNTGAGVNAYIIDTGILLTHNDLGGRAVTGFDAVTANGNASDCNGHGTHVAGTVGGTTWGVAKAVKLYAVRVLGCNGSGTTSGVIAGVDWVTANRVKPAVANMSLGGGASSTLDAAVRNSIAAGVTYAIAAGNGDFIGRQLDACTQSPARVTEGITIGATNSSDAKASWSNYGNCVDFFAPGVSITSAWYTSNTATNTISGTSMAAPHVAGAAALYLQANPNSTPQQVRDALYAATTKGIVTSSSTANNHLLYTNPGTATPANNPPTASFNYSCTGLTCSFTDTSTDSDGSIASRSWTFGDGTSSTATNPSKTYASASTYTVSLTVTDNGGATNSTSKTVTVSSGSTGGGITLAATGYKVKGLLSVDLSWSGVSGGTVDVYRGAVKINTANDGAHTDATGLRGGGTLTYRVCQTGSTTVCSADAVVTY